jgi:mannose-1-phosphate guanylyltransferase
MFVFRCSDYLSALDQYAPDMLAGCRRAAAAARSDNGLWLDPDEFAITPADSIDYAVMERTTRAAVVPLDAGWSDVGSWTALWEASTRDKDGNALVGDVVATGVTNSYVRSEHRLVTVAGLDNVVVVETPDSVLVTTLDGSQAVKQIVDILREQGRDEATRATQED